MPRKTSLLALGAAIPALLASGFAGAPAAAASRPVVIAQADTQELTPEELLRLEEAQQEEQAAEEQPTEEPEPEAQAAEEQPAEEPQPEAQAAEEQPAEEPQPEAQAAEEQPAEEPQPEAQAAEEQPAEEPQPEAQAAEEQPAEEPQPEAQAAEEQPAEEPQPEAQATEAQPTEEPKAESQTTETQPTEESKPEAQTLQAEPAEEPKAESQTTETQSTEEPKPEARTLQAAPAEEPASSEEEQAESPKTLSAPTEDGARQATSGDDRTRSRDGDGRDRRHRDGDRDRDRNRARGERIDEPRFQAPPDARRVERAQDNRVIFNLDSGEVVVRHDETRRLRRDARDVYYERLPNGLVRTTIERPNGSQIITIEDEYGNVLERTRITRDGRQIVLFSAPREAYDRRGRDLGWQDPMIDLPPIRVTIPDDEYVVEADRADREALSRALESEPVEALDRSYSLEDVRYSERLRDLMPRIDLDGINFETGSAEITISEIEKLSDLAYAIEDLLDEDPGETFLIEGHTDAVGGDNMNLALSDRRAESVASALTEVYDIPPENLVTQGYGERYLKVPTDGPERENRRVTVRRITPLVNPVARAR